MPPKSTAQVECTICHNWYKPLGFPSHQKACRWANEQWKSDVLYEERARREEQEQKGMCSNPWHWSTLDQYSYFPAQNVASCKFTLQPKPWEDVSLLPKKRPAPQPSQRGVSHFLKVSTYYRLMAPRICSYCWSIAIFQFSNPNGARNRHYPNGIPSS